MALEKAAINRAKVRKNKNVEALAKAWVFASVGLVRLR
jgi:hypothetical protein